MVFLLPTAFAVRSTGHLRKSSGFEAEPQDVPRGVQIGVLDMTARRADEHGLADAVVWMDVAARAAFWLVWAGLTAITREPCQPTSFHTNPVDLIEGCSRDNKIPQTL
jgi:hypothetical protein